MEIKQYIYYCLNLLVDKLFACKWQPSKVTANCSKVFILDTNNISKASYICSNISALRPLKNNFIEQHHIKNKTTCRTCLLLLLSLSWDSAVKLSWRALWFCLSLPARHSGLIAKKTTCLSKIGHKKQSSKHLMYSMYALVPLQITV